jgi:hypothetical protein
MWRAAPQARVAVSWNNVGDQEALMRSGSITRWKTRQDFLCRYLLKSERTRARERAKSQCRISPEKSVSRNTYTEIFQYRHTTHNKFHTPVHDLSIINNKQIQRKMLRDLKKIRPDFEACWFCEHTEWTRARNVSTCVYYKSIKTVL